MIRSIRNLTVLCLLLASATVLAQDRQYAPPFGLSQPMLSYDLHSGEMPPADLPRLRVYSDGLVLVHYPPFMKRAGDYHTWLDETEMQSLIAGLGHDVLEFDSQQVSRKLASLAKNDDGYVHATGDPDLSVFSVRLSLIEDQRIQWQSRQATVRWAELGPPQHYADLPELQRLAQVQVTLQGLIERAVKDGGDQQ